MVEAVTVAVPDTSATEDEANAASIAAAAEAGVVVNGEVVEAVDTSPQRPENVPEKFWDAEKGEVKMDEVLKSNAELQAQFTKSKQPGEEPAAEDAPEGEDDAAKAADDPIKSARDEYAESGELSADTYAALEKAGLSKDMVDDYISAQTSKADAANASAYALTDGKENFGKMSEWAAENLTPQEVADFNAQVINTETSDHAITALFAKYQAEADLEPALIGGENSGGGEPAGGHFKSSSEMTAAMRDPQYVRDAAFRAEVTKKIANSTKQGINLFV